MPLRVRFIRHGESHANIDRVFANRPEVPAALTPAGVEAAHALAPGLAADGVTHIYTSPIQRARETAAILGQVTGAPVTVTDALREYDVGEDEGWPYHGADAWRWERYRAVVAAWLRDDRDARHPGGESLADIAARFLPFMMGLTITHAATDRPALVGHAGLYLAALPLILEGVTMAQAHGLGLGHTETVVARWDCGRWTCESWGPHRLGDG